MPSICPVLIVKKVLKKLSSFIICGKHGEINLISGFNGSALRETAGKLSHKSKNMRRKKSDRKQLMSSERPSLMTPSMKMIGTDRVAAMKQENALLRHLVVEKQDKNEIFKQAVSFQQQKIHILILW